MDQITRKQIDERHYIIAEQIIAPDGRPAVKVRTWRQYQKNTPECLSEMLYCFPTPTPSIIFGRPVVGQWSDKKWRPPARWWELDGVERPNFDQSTYQDFFAWSDATDAVYSQS